MNKIEINYNIESFSSKEYNNGHIKIQIAKNVFEKISLESNVENIVFENRFELVSLFEKIRGTDTNSLTIKFYEKKFFKWAKANFYEQQAFKSLLLIYTWLELSLMNPNDLDIKKGFFNEFIIDWNFKPQSQHSIYLLNESVIIPNNFIYLDKLLELNLLNRIEITLEDKILKNYFIPLLTPGVSLEYFISDFDKNGQKTQRLWKQILKDRDYRIQTWVNNRF
ncbi:hypothetical protein [Chryseobacterium sp. JM1]|uniref:hypothetical protein n=1 Tax=Chryseobacterium sp. JM1 TaxID=1233950 RepID=UPI0004E62AD8|nr:hypothetical protein [Chryseobacterium sp. JM1]KFF22916.1 hypothetical protein IW22_01325 [Chryseobacterium sp. JM1]